MAALQVDRELREQLVDAWPGVSDRATQPGCIVAQCAWDGDGESRLFATGLADLEHRVPINLDTRFEVGSLAKQVTVAAMLSVLESPTDLDREVGDFVPTLKHFNGITIADLATHRSGLRDFGAMLAVAGSRDLDFWDRADVLGLISRQRSVRTTRFYSNSHYAVIAEVVRSAGGAPLSDVVRECIFDPLGMASSEFRSDPASLIPGRARSYSTGAGQHEWRNADRFDTVVGPHGLWSSAPDMLAWAAAARHATFLSPWARTVFTAPPSDARRYGYGRQWQTYRGVEIVGHAGNRHGFRTALWTTTDGACVVLANGGDIPASRLAVELITADKTGQPRCVAAATSLAKTPSAPAGIYWSLDDGSVVSVRYDGADVLLGDSDGSTTRLNCSDRSGATALRLAAGGCVEVFDGTDGRVITQLIPLDGPQAVAVRPGSYVSPEYGLHAEISGEGDSISVSIGRTSWQLTCYGTGRYATDGFRLIGVEGGLQICVPRAPMIDFKYVAAERSC